MGNILGMAEVDQTGTMTTCFLHQFTPQLRCKLFGQIQPTHEILGKINNEYTGDDFTASLTFANSNMIDNSSMLVAQYLQSLTERIALGAKIVYQYGPNICGGQESDVSAIGRYTYGDAVWSGVISMTAAQICYHQQLNDHFRIGVEFETNKLWANSVALACYQISIPQHDVVFRGSIDSGWNLCGVIEKNMYPLPFSLALTGRLNRSRNYLRMGFGVAIG